MLAQDNCTLEKMYNNLKNRTFIVDVRNYDKKKSKLIDKKRKIRLLKILDFTDAELFYPIHINTINNTEMNETLSSGATLILHLKSINKNILIDYSQGESITKKKKYQFNLKLSLKNDYASFFYIFLNSFYKVEILARIVTKANNTINFEKGISNLYIYGCRDSEYYEYNKNVIFTEESFTDIVKEIYLNSKGLTLDNCKDNQILSDRLPNWIR